MRKPLKPWDDKTQAEVFNLLVAIVDGYSFQVHDDRIIVIDNPDWDGDPSGDQHLAVDVASLFENGTPLDPTTEDMEAMEAEILDEEVIETQEA